MFAEHMDTEKELIKAIITISRQMVYIGVVIVSCMGLIIFFLTKKPTTRSLVVISIKNTTQSRSVIDLPPNASPNGSWKAPDKTTIPSGKAGNMIRYGQELLRNTAKYLGPNGTVAHITNGMNCQNCHLSGGSKLFANNYAGFISSYPKFSGRSGKVEPATERISECFERSLNSKAPDTLGKEVQSILAYMKWIGKDVKKGQKLYGIGTEKLAFMETATDPIAGKAVFMSKCQSCHGAKGEGQLAPDKKTYIYPPLWGKHSYNDGAGMFRLTNFAGFVKNNMPFGVTYKNPQLSDKDAWNVAAFVNSQPRPHRDQRNDWHNLKMKPIDFPFGPYADKFTERQHKYGPFSVIKEKAKKPAI